LEEKKNQFIEIGEETYNKMLDCYETSDFQSILSLCAYFDTYFQFFRSGFQFLSDKRKEINDIKQRAEQQQSKYETEHIKRIKGKWLPQYLGSSISKRIFGVDYLELVAKEELVDGLPTFLNQIITELEKRCLNSMGIFRLSGAKPEIDALIEQIELGQPLNLSETDENVLASIFKSFF